MALVFIIPLWLSIFSSSAFCLEFSERPSIRIINTCFEHCSSPTSLLFIFISFFPPGFEPTRVGCQRRARFRSTATEAQHFQSISFSSEKFFYADLRENQFSWWRGKISDEPAHDKSLLDRVMTLKPHKLSK